MENKTTATATANANRYKGYYDGKLYKKVHAMTGESVKDSVITLYSYNADSNVVAVCKLDCKLRNVKNHYSLALSIGKEWYADMLSQATKDRDKLNERKDGEEPLSEEEVNTLGRLVDWIDDLKAIHDFDNAEPLDNFGKLVYFTRYKKGDLPGIVAGAAKDIITARKTAESPKAKPFKESVDIFVGLLSTKEEGNTLDFRFNANSRLLTDVYSAAYKGRALNKDGRVRAGKLSEKNAAFEILLACIEELQKKQAEKEERDKEAKNT